MIRSYWYFAIVAVAAGLLVLGPYGAPLAVVGLAFGIFFGTVSIRGHLLSPGSHNVDLAVGTAVDLAVGTAPAPIRDATTTPPGA